MNDEKEELSPQLNNIPQSKAVLTNHNFGDKSVYTNQQGHQL